MDRFAAACLIALALAGCGATREQLREAGRDCRERNSDTAEAIAACSELLKQDPAPEQRATYLAARGTAYARSDQAAPAMADLTVQLDLPAPAGGQNADLAINPGDCASVPPSMLVPANALSADFTVTSGACAGDEIVTASIGLATSDATVSVVDSPAFPNLVIAEVYYNHTSTEDNQNEWVKIYNGTGVAVNLAGYSIGYGGTDYTYGVLGLAGMLNNGECFLVGGPNGNAVSGFPAAPVFDQAIDFNPDIQNSGATADGVALFDVAPAAVTAATVPIDAVLYGANNTNGLIDESGAPAPVHVADSGPENSIRLQGDGTWAVEPNPAPLSCVPFP